MKYFNCLDCNHFGDSCYDCERFLHQFNKYNTNFKDNIESYNFPSLTSIPDSCCGCPNHPSNGGNGFCHCILGQYNITWEDKKCILLPVLRKYP